MSKRILTMQDLSCVGQCSLTVALPILSALGVEASILPTAILSNHTMFPSWSYLDLTPEIPNIFEHWKRNRFTFEAFLLGYLGKAELMNVAERCFDEFAAENAKIIIDPVLGDNGKLYSGFDLNYVAAMRKLIKRADFILPNVTEACFLTGVEYRESYDAKFVCSLAQELTKLTDAQMIITGCLFGDKIAEVIYDNQKSEVLLHERIPQNKHGTGDIFSSVFTANYLQGKNIRDACNAAAEFVATCMQNTAAEHFYGVDFEKCLNGKK